MKVFFSSIHDSLQIERRRLCFSCNKNCSMVWDGLIFAGSVPLVPRLSLSLSRSRLILICFPSFLSFHFSLCVFSLFLPFNITSHVVHPKCSLTFLSAAPLGVSEWILSLCVCVCAHDISSCGRDWKLKCLSVFQCFRGANGLIADTILE